MDSEKNRKQKGRSMISDDRRTSSFSKRAKQGSLSVEKKNCPYCTHHKAFSYVGRDKFRCSRCKKEY